MIPTAPLLGQLGKELLDEANYIIEHDYYSRKHDDAHSVLTTLESCDFAIINVKNQSFMFPFFVSIWLAICCLILRAQENRQSGRSI